MSSIVALPPPAALTLGERLRGLTALAAARVILTATNARPGPLRRALTPYAVARPAGRAQAERAFTVITILHPRCGGDTGCLLRSIAVAMFCRTAGTWPTWRSGVRYPPLHSHAWIEVDGRPVGEPAHLIATYTPTITITAHSTTTTGGASRHDR
ncbi:lasso peptide biosynthesis B2 protein [Actinomadura violacea]|uniref:Lasso peptide biosynthesis B2 protein n=1 Tax=Actinomadura violacea TaxID=2819934 RepID=A0ABS3S8T1_9ACTN|nr:lasso peptide biosynthesis B2 protein [Actinomadura violacea]MBO2464978.1 lasso peptide biosynthesis B2 protein [Actinomadura violacea]